MHCLSIITVPGSACYQQRSQAVVSAPLYLHLCKWWMLQTFVVNGDIFTVKDDFFL